MMFKSFLFVLLLTFALFAQTQEKNKRITELLNSGKTRQAEQRLLKKLSVNPKQPEVIYYLGIVNLMDGDYEKAIDHFAEAIKLDDSDYRFYENLGDAYGMKAQKGSIFKAVFVIGDMRSNWEKAIELKPDLVSARERLFSYYLMAPGIAGGDDEKALTLANEVLQLNPAAGHMLLARFYSKQEKSELAEKEFLAAAAIDSTNGNIFNQAGYFYLRQNKPKKALNWFSKYVALEPENSNAYDSKGDAFLKSEQYDSALVMFETALQKNPSFESSLFKRAKTLKKLNHKSQARQAARAYLKKYPDGRYSGKAEDIIDD